MGFADEKIRKKIVPLYSNGFGAFTISDWEQMINSNLRSSEKITKDELKLLSDIVEKYKYWTAQMFVLQGINNQMASKSCEDFYKFSIYSFLTGHTKGFIDDGELRMYCGREIATVNGYSMEYEKYELSALGLVARKVLLSICETVYPGMYQERFRKEVEERIVYEVPKY